MVAGECLRIPYRVYFHPKEMDDLGLELDGTASVVLLCIGTRSHDGYSRERFLRALLARPASWVVPYVLALIGEYVVEIMQPIIEAWPSLDHRAYAAFARDNGPFIALTRRRVLSYWDCYYRPAMPLDDYPGMRLLRLLDAAVAAPAEVSH